MNTSKKITRFVSLAVLALAICLPASGQAPAGAGQPDEVDQLAQMVGLTEEQQSKIRAVIAEISPEIEKLQAEAQEAQQKLYEKAGADFVEKEIREGAAALGKLTGEITALTIILQSRVDGVFTNEQREQLDALQQQQQRMQQQQMQQRMQEQLQQQMQQQQPER